MDRFLAEFRAGSIPSRCEKWLTGVIMLMNIYLFGGIDAA
jgi:hypothetical protein